MWVIGILGGVASGKSLVAKQLVRLGAGLLDADRAGHNVIQLPEVQAAARERWGDEIFDPQGEIDRGRLAEIVFALPPDGPREREYLEQLTHPLIGGLLGEEVERLRRAGCVAVVLDAPLLVEVGWDSYCDKLIFVDAPRPTRLARALERGWSEKEFAAREGVQESLDSKRKRADVVVDNSGFPEETQARLERFWYSLIG